MAPGALGGDAWRGGQRTARHPSFTSYRENLRCGSRAASRPAASSSATEPRTPHGAAVERKKGRRAVCSPPLCVARGAPPPGASPAPPLAFRAERGRTSSWPRAGPAPLVPNGQGEEMDAPRAADPTSRGGRITPCDGAVARAAGLCDAPCGGRLSARRPSTPPHTETRRCASSRASRPAASWSATERRTAPPCAAPHRVSGRRGPVPRRSFSRSGKESGAYSILKNEILTQSPQSLTQSLVCAQANSADSANSA